MTNYVNKVDLGQKYMEFHGCHGNFKKLMDTQSTHQNFRTEWINSPRKFQPL